MLNFHLTEEQQKEKSMRLSFDAESIGGQPSDRIVQAGISLPSVHIIYPT
jgi:hypothetical protein